MFLDHAPTRITPRQAAQAVRRRRWFVGLHWASLVILLALAVLSGGMAYYSDNRDRDDDLFGFVFMLAPALTVVGAALVLGLLTLRSRNSMLVSVHRVSSVIAIILASLMVLGNLLMIPVVIALWMGLRDPLATS